MFAKQYFSMVPDPDSEYLFAIKSPWDFAIHLSGWGEGGDFKCGKMSTISKKLNGQIDF